MSNGAKKRDVRGLITPADLLKSSEQALLRVTNIEEEEVMAKAEAQCQSLWNGLHKSRSKVEDIDGAMAEIGRQCRDIRAEARQKCRSLRWITQQTNRDFSKASNDLTY